MTRLLRLQIGHRIVLSFCLLVLAVVSIGGWGIYRLVLGQFERQMSVHLVTVSKLVSDGLDGDVIGQVTPRYGVYARLLAHLENVRMQVGAARIAVIGSDGMRVLDTQGSNAFGLPFARLAFDRDEIEQVWAGQAVHSVAFYDASGAVFQTGYAPLYRQGQVVAIVAVELGVGFVEAMEAFRQSLLVLGGVSILLTVLVGFVLSRTLTRPIEELVKAAEVIGTGQLDHPVKVSADDELGTLAKTLDEMRRQLASRDEQLRQMLAGVAHEIRNPLGGIELYAGFIAHDLDDADPRREHILKVISEVRNLDQVISDFLTFARPAALQMETVILQDVVSDALFLLGPEMEQASVLCAPTLDVKDTILADAAQIKAAVVNVLKNAIQAMPQGGNLGVRLEQDAKFLRVIVTDDGPGISSADQAQVLTPFFTTKEKGSGLGLSIVQQIMSQHNGQLQIESKEGEGTTVGLIFERVT